MIDYEENSNFEKIGILERNDTNFDYGTQMHPLLNPNYMGHEYTIQICSPYSNPFSVKNKQFFGVFSDHQKSEYLYLIFHQGISRVYSYLS